MLELDHGAQYVSAETSRRISCDAAVVTMRHDVDGAVLDVGRRTRTIPKSARSVARSGRSPVTAPAEATTTRAMADHCVLLRCSFSSTVPAMAAMAGSKLMSVPKVFVDRRRSANISSVQGSALEKMATATPTGRIAGSMSLAPASTMPIGTVRRAATISSQVEAVAPCARPAFWPNTMYIAQPPPATSAHGHAQRADEFDGHGDAERDAPQRHVEDRVHGAERAAVGRGDGDVGVANEAPYCRAVVLDRIQLHEDSTTSNLPNAIRARPQPRRSRRGPSCRRRR